MSIALNLFPARVPIGTVQPDRTVLMTPEFVRALRAVSVRLGGSEGLSTDDLAILASSVAQSDATQSRAIEDIDAVMAPDWSGQVAALLAEVQDLRSQATQFVQMQAELAELRKDMAGLSIAPFDHTFRAELAEVRKALEGVELLATFRDPYRVDLTRPGPIGSLTASTGAFTTLSASGASFTGTPTAPTAAVDTNTTQIATTAFVLNQASAANPLMNGTVAVGTSTRYSRQDHVHPSDTSREAAITAGTTSQYWRGDKTFQTLNQAAVTGLKTTDKPTFAGVSPYSGQQANVGPGTINVATTSDMGGICIITARQGGIGTSTRWVSYNNRGGTLVLSVVSTLVNTADPVTGVAVSGANIQVTLSNANTNVQYGFVDIPT